MGDLVVWTIAFYLDGRLYLEVTRTRQMLRRTFETLAAHARDSVLTTPRQP